MNRTLALTLTAALLAAPASAQTALTLSGAVTRALSANADLGTATANLRKAQATLTSRQADPTTLILDLTSAQQDVARAQVTLAGTRLNVLQTVINQYTALFETRERINLNSAQVNLGTRNVQIAQARQRARTGTALDVTRAQNTLAQDRQELTNARASLNVQSAQLAKTLGLPANSTFTLAAPPAAPALTLSLDTLSSGLDARLASLAGAAQAVQTAQLQVRLSDNDYTPRRTLEDARTALANAERDLDTARAGAVTQVRDAYRAAQDAQERVALARATLRAQQTTLTQTQARLRAGTVAQIDVQTAQVNVQNAQLSVTQAQDTLWKVLAALSVAAGRDVTGLAGQ